MKTKILSYIAAGALVALTSGCGDVTINPELEGTGKLSFANFGITVEASKALPESRAESAEVDASNFLVTVKKNSVPGSTVVQPTPFCKLPGVIDLAPGSYTILVESHKVQKAEWENPYYKGSTTVTVEDDKVADAGSVNCKFASMRVSVAFSTKLTPLLGDDVTVTVDVNDGGHIVFTKDDFKRSAYFEVVAGSTTLVSHLEGTINGVHVDKIETYNNVAAGLHHTITYRVQGLPDPPEETGGLDPTEGIKIYQDLESKDQKGNVTLEEEVLGSNDRPGQETPDPNDPNKPDDPTPPATDAIKITSETISFDEINDIVEGKDYVVNITSENGIAHINVKIESPYLTEEFLNGVNMTANFDLANPPKSYEEGIKGLGLPVGNEVIGAKEIVFDLTQFIPMLSFDESEVKRVHTFILEVIDEKGNSNTKTLKFQEKQ